MKKVLMMIALCLSLCVGTGCQTFDPVAASEIASLTGQAAAITVLQVPAIATNMQVRAAIAEVTKAVQEVVPATNQTFTAAAIPVVNDVVNKMVAQGKLKPEYSLLVKEGSIMVFSGIDLVMVKYPKAKETTTNVNIVVKAFLTSFNATFAPGGLSASRQSTEVLDLVDELKAKNKELLTKLIK